MTKDQMPRDWEIEDLITEKDNTLFFDGVSMPKLADEFGSPLFVISERRIAANIRRIKEPSRETSPRLKVCYASKANSTLAVLRTVRKAGSDVEVNSGGELFKARQAGFSPEQIIFNGTSKDRREISEAMEAGIFAIQADSYAELEIIAELARSAGRKVDVSLRLVPEILTETLVGLRTALRTTKFGMMPEEALEAFKRWGNSDSPLNLTGLHIHLGSQNPSPEPYRVALKILYAVAKRIREATGATVSHFNIGGGYPVNFFRDSSHKDQMSAEQVALLSSSYGARNAIDDAWEEIIEVAEKEEARDVLDGIDLVIEPGRSIIADAGLCLTTIRNIKSRPLSETEQDDWLLTDAGFNILLSMETYKWYYHLVSASQASEVHDTRYRVAGPLCDGGDVYFDIEGHNRLPDHRLLPDGMKIGDVLALLNCGAYSIAQMFPYNGRPLPAVVMIGENGDVKLARKRDEYTDLLRNEL